MSTGRFQRMNTRAAKVNGEMVLWIRQQYAAMLSYPRIREELQLRFGVTLSIQQITRIAKGQSFANIGGDVLPTEHEVNVTMHANARTATEPTAEEIAASQERLQALLDKDAAPRESIQDVLARREANVRAHVEELAKRRAPTLEEIEARERAAMGTASGKGAEKLAQLQEELRKKEADSQPASQPQAINAGTLLETLK